MSAAASASAASSIPRMCWSAPRRCGFGRPVKWIEDRREHLIAANHSRQQLHRIRAAVDARRPHPRHRRRVLPRPGRLCAHARGHRARPRRGDAAGPLSRAGLSRRRPHPPDQQDAGRHLSRAGPLREHVRARAADRRDRRQGRHRPRRGAPAQPDRARPRCPTTRPLETLGTACRARFRRLCGPARQGAGRHRLGRAAARARDAPRSGRSWSASASACSSRRAGSARSTACGSRSTRRARSRSSPARPRSGRASRP